MNQQTKFSLGIQSGTLTREVKDHRVSRKYITSFMFPCLQIQPSPDQLELLCHKFRLKKPLTQDLLYISSAFSAELLRFNPIAMLLKYTNASPGLLHRIGATCRLIQARGQLSSPLFILLLTGKLLIFCTLLRISNVQTNLAHSCQVESSTGN